MRLNKFMALAGVDSRRKCDDIIQSGRVRVNARVVRKLGTVIDENRDLVTLDNKPIRIRGNFVYYMLNKPVGVVTTVKDPYGRRTVIDCMPKIGKRIWPIGRLDYETSGLLLLTNDGDTAQKLIHPSFELDKVYLATINGQLSNEDLQKLRNGVNIGGFVTSPAQVDLEKQQLGQSTYRVVIHEGKNRQIRRMFEAVGSKVETLRRIAIGKLNLGDLPIGHSRELTQEEINYILSL